MARRRGSSSWDAMPSAEGEWGMTRYLVVLTSDEECVTHEVEWSPEIAAAVSAVAQAINAKATWSCSPRLHVNKIAQQGEVA